ncbi:hypothetical protein MKW94_000752 [Papaver nudicaule]|uniref:Pectinesterase inhibitor domain-containing protein n=1 Tax=Papaver nudicaule TaxID=74823 RepID=A0AA41V7I9_PAPNU|nr:hypothetical protein [Papaver nudicaule]
MNQSTSLLSPFASILYFFLVLKFYMGVIVTGDIISSQCKNVSTHDFQVNYDSCVSSLEANPLSKTSDIFGLAVISMELCSNNASYIQTYIDSISKDGKADPGARVCLGNCIEFYSMAFRAVQKAMKAFSGKDYVTSLVEIGAAMDSSETCKDAFTEAGVDFGLLRKQYDDFFQLTAVSLGIITNINGPLQ